MVSHYKKFHKESEVFLSRLSPTMAESIKHQQKRKTYFTPKIPFDHIKSKCYFCNDVKGFDYIYWEQHLSTHTGEYLFYCAECNEETSNAGNHVHAQSTKRKEKPHNFMNDLIGYICLDCNFIQIKRENMIKHLRKEHEFEKEILSSKYQAVILLPSKKHWICVDNNGNFSFILIFLFKNDFINVPFQIDLLHLFDQCNQTLIF